MFDQNATIEYIVPGDSEVTIKVHDTSGNPVANVIDREFRTAGSYSKTLNSGNLTPGVYIVSYEVCNTLKGKIGIKQ